MTASQDILYEARDNVGWLTFNRPESLNSFTPELLAGAVRALEEAEVDEAVRVIVMTGAGRAFSSGGNVKRMDRHNASGEAYPPTHHRLAAKLSLKIDRFPKPIIACVNGVAAGAGFELALQADLRIAAEEAYLKPAALRLGLVAGDGSAFFLPRLVGAGRANQILFLEESINSADALQLGLFNWVVPLSELGAATVDLAARLARQPPLAVAATKRAIKLGATRDLAAVMDYLDLAVAGNRTTEDHAEGLAAFKERRLPHFKGR